MLFAPAGPQPRLLAGVEVADGLRRAATNLAGTGLRPSGSSTSECSLPRRGPNPASSPALRSQTAFGEQRRIWPALVYAPPDRRPVNALCPGGAPTPPPRRR